MSPAIFHHKHEDCEKNDKNGKNKKVNKTGALQLLSRKLFKEIIKYHQLDFCQCQFGNPVSVMMRNGKEQRNQSQQTIR